jgi:hypothetical protein
MSPSLLTWIDHDPQARERTNQILSLFDEKETRDELGLGPVVSSLSERMFPGTSSVLTRLRYVFFIPWLYQRLEDKKIYGEDLAAKLAVSEEKLINSLRRAADDKGLIGKYSRGNIKRLPSSIYWHVLNVWGFKHRPAETQERYHRRLWNLYEIRDIYRRHARSAEKKGEDSDEALYQSSLSWHPGLPKAPADFPERADFLLTADEAGFVFEQIVSLHGQSLLAHLASARRKSSVSFI